MLSFDLLPSDALLQVVAFLNLRDALSLSMVGLCAVPALLTHTPCKVSKLFHSLTQEHGFWLGPLLNTRPSQPLPCPSNEDFAVHSAVSLRRLAIHTLRLDRNWACALPCITGPIRTFPCGDHDSILFCLPGIDLIVMYSPTDHTIICCNLENGISTAPTYVGRIHDKTPPIEGERFTTVALLASTPDDLHRNVHIHFVLIL